MLNWLVVGIGDITTRRVIPAILAEPRSRLRGIVTRDLRKAAPYSVPAWTDLDQALRESEADAVYIPTPVFLHAPQTLAALEAGKHVLCEKPAAMNVPEAEQMVRRGKEAGKTLGIAYYRRLFSKVQRARQLLGQGAIGRPVLATATCHSSRPDGNAQRNWLLDPAKAGGGPLYDTASHRIDLFNYLFGRPRRVTAQLSNVVHQFPVEDSATVLIEYENLVRAVVDVRWHCRVPSDVCRIVGTDGDLDLTPLSGPDLSYPGGHEDLPSHQNVHYPCIENFVDSIENGDPLMSSGESALWTGWVTEQAVGAAGSSSDIPESRHGRVGTD